MSDVVSITGSSITIVVNGNTVYPPPGSGVPPGGGGTPPTGDGPYPGNNVIMGYATQAAPRAISAQAIGPGTTWAVEVKTTATQYPRDYNNVGKISVYNMGGFNGQIRSWISLVPNGAPITYNPQSLAGPTAAGLNPNWTYGVQTMPPGQNWYIIDLPLDTVLYVNCVVTAQGPAQLGCEFNMPKLLQ